MTDTPGTIEVEYERTTLTHDQMTPSPNNPRGEITDASVADLAQSILERGVQQAISVEHDGEIKFGHRRHHAIGLLIRTKKLPADYEIPVDMATSAGDEAHQVGVEIDRLIENLQRTDINPMDEARAFYRLIDFGQSQSDLATKIGVSKGHVSKRLALLRLPEDVQAQVGDTITLERALALAAIKDPAKVKKLAGPGISDHQITTELEAQKADVARDKFVNELERLNITVKQTRQQSPNLPKPGAGKMLAEVGEAGSRGHAAEEFKGSVPKAATHAAVYMGWGGTADVRYRLYQEIDEPAVEPGADVPTPDTATAPKGETAAERKAREKRQAEQREQMARYRAERALTATKLAERAKSLSKTDAITLIVDQLADWIGDDLDIDLDEDSPTRTLILKAAGLPEETDGIRNGNNEVVQILTGTDTAEAVKVKILGTYLVLAHGRFPGNVVVRRLKESITPTEEEIVAWLAAEAEQVKAQAAPES